MTEYEIHTTVTYTTDGGTTEGGYFVRYVTAKYNLAFLTESLIEHPS